MPDLHIIDLGVDRPAHYRYAVGTAEPDPWGGDGRWVRIEVRAIDVDYHAHLERVATESDDEIITVTDDDEVTG